MTIYAGETVRIRNASTFQARALTPADLDPVTCSIYDSNLSPVVDAQSMSWDDGTNNDNGFVGFYYDWASNGMASGTYLVRVHEVGPGVRESWEYLKLKLNADKLSSASVPTDSAGFLSLSMRMGDTFTDTLTWATGGVAIDLTGYTFEARMKPLDASSPVVTISTSCPSPTSGQVDLFLSLVSGATPVVTPGTWAWTFRWTTPGDVTSTVLFGLVTVKDELSV